MTANTYVTMYGPNGVPIKILAIDQGDGTYRLATDTSLTTGAITLGSVHIEDGVGAALGTVKAASTIAESDNGLAVQAPVLGTISAAAVTADATGTISAKMRGLVKMLSDVWDSTLHALNIEGKGTAGAAAGGVLTVQGDPAGTAIPVSIPNPGSNTLKSGDSALIARVAGSTVVASGDNALAVHDPVIGQTADASSALTLVGLLKAIKAFFGAGLPAALSGGGFLTTSMKEAFFDAVSSAAGTKQIVVMEQIHDYVHDGLLFSANHLFSAVANNGNADFQITVGATMCHEILSFAVDGQSQLAIYEAPTSTVGTPITPVNLNRNSANVPASSVVFTPTVTVVGTLLAQHEIPGGTTGGSSSRSGSLAREGSEWVLKPNTKYLFRVTNLSGSAENISMTSQFYEQNV